MRNRVLEDFDGNQIPEFVADLEAVPEYWRELYRRDARSGRWFLPPGVFDAMADEFKAGREQLAKLKAEGERKIAELDAKIERAESAIISKKFEAALRAALEQYVRPDLITGAIAFLRAELGDALRFDAHDRLGVVVAGSMVPVAHYLARWIETPDGAAFRKPRDENFEPGFLTRQLRSYTIH